ncbi:hypothetical protein OG948_35845 (plasmid) [Embleya sp. NBC_00888]|uniref:hypothetical protein n=1 Tax=Embleya sp. NBC_00888 TaxID=2975960 RepID=UPI00386DB6DB|nr:hypothetical protein OG948_35845 [Embleya sp. NBC_00888]
MTPEDLMFEYGRVQARGVEVYEGTALDVRVVTAGVSRRVRDGFLLGQVPWGGFSHAYGSGEDVLGYLERMRSVDAAAARGRARRWAAPSVIGA